MTTGSTILSLRKWHIGGLLVQMAKQYSIRCLSICQHTIPNFLKGDRQSRQWLKVSHSASLSAIRLEFSHTAIMQRCCLAIELEVHTTSRKNVLVTGTEHPMDYSHLLQMVWTPTLCIPDMSDRPGYFLISLSNLAMSLITYGAPCITLLCSTFTATLLHIWRHPYPYFRISFIH